MVGVGVWSPLLISEGPVVCWHRKNYYTDQSNVPFPDAQVVPQWNMDHLSVIFLVKPLFSSAIFQPCLMTPEGYFGSFGSVGSAGPAQTLRLLRHLGGSTSAAPALLPAALAALAKQRAAREAMTLVDDALGRRARRGGPGNSPLVSL